MIGNNSYIGEGCVLEKSLVLGNDYYTNEKTRAASLEKADGCQMAPIETQRVAVLSVSTLMPVQPAPMPSRIHTAVSSYGIH